MYSYGKFDHVYVFYFVGLRGYAVMLYCCCLSVCFWLFILVGPVLKTYAAIFPRLETCKVIWVLSFDLSRIRINTSFRYSYVISVFRHFIDKIK